MFVLHQPWRVFVLHQPWRVLVLQSDEAIAKIRSLTHWAFNTPTVMLVCADHTVSWKNVDGHDSAQVDVAIYATHMMMEAWELGVGPTWVRGYDERVIHEAFDLPASWEVVAMLPMGYPADNARPSNWHYSRFPVGKTCMFL